MSDTMKVVAFVEAKKVEIKEVKRPKAHPHQIIMKVHGCSICTFEQRMFQGVVHIPFPYVGGHEVFGEVAEVGSKVNAKNYPVGTKIVARLLNACGECYYCRRGEENLCINGNDLEVDQMDIPGIGGLAQYIALNAKQVYKMPEDTDLKIGVFAEPLACVLNSIEIGHPEVGDDVVVLGGGIMGQLHVLIAKMQGCRVVMSEPDPVRREHAKRLGCDIVINPFEVDPVEYVKSITEGRGAEVVFNTTAVAAVAKQAVLMTAPLGRTVMYSTVEPDTPFEVSGKRIHNTQMNITGAVSPTVRSFDRAVRLLSKRIVDPTSLVYGVYSHLDAQNGFEAAIDPKTMRVIIDFKD